MQQKQIQKHIRLIYKKIYCVIRIYVKCLQNFFIIFLINFYRLSEKN